MVQISNNSYSTSNYRNPSFGLKLQTTGYDFWNACIPRQVGSTVTNHGQKIYLNGAFPVESEEPARYILAHKELQGLLKNSRNLGEGVVNIIRHVDSLGKKIIIQLIKGKNVHEVEYTKISGNVRDLAFELKQAITRLVEQTK